MVSRARILIITTLLSVAVAAQAQPPVKDRRFCQALLVRTFLVDALMESLGKRTFLLHDKDSPGRVFRLDLGVRLGAGVGGAIYEVNYVIGTHEMEGVTNEGGPLIVKFPHSPKHSRGVLRYPHSALLARNEAEIYENIRTHAGELAASRWYPKDAYWKPGSLPVIPIIKAVRTEKGLLLFKPRIKGVSIEELVSRYPAGLPREVVNSARAIFELGQAMFETIHVKGLHPLDPSGVEVNRLIAPDLNPTNLVWVENPAEIARLKLMRPGFVFYEVGEFTSDAYRQDKMPFDEYLKQFYSLGKH